MIYVHKPPDRKILLHNQQWLLYTPYLESSTYITSSCSNKRKIIPSEVKCTYKFNILKGERSPASRFYSHTRQNQPQILFTLPKPQQPRGPSSSCKYYHHVKRGRIAFFNAIKLAIMESQCTPAVYLMKFPKAISTNFQHATIPTVWCLQTQICNGQLFLCIAFQLSCSRSMYSIKMHLAVHRNRIIFSRTSRCLTA